MSDILSRICRLISEDRFRVSLHVLREIQNDDLLIGPLVSGIESAVLVEEYPGYHKGPAVLVLQNDEHGKPIHLLWGIPIGATEPAVLITAYLPDPDRWEDDFIRRKAR